MEDITSAESRHSNKVWKNFVIKKIEYHDLYIQNHTLLLVDVSENFRNMCLKVYTLHPAHFISTPGLASQTS